MTDSTTFKFFTFPNNDTLSQKIHGELVRLLRVDGTMALLKPVRIESREPLTAPKFGAKAMLKTISALALAAASMTAPAVAQDVKAPVAAVNAPVAPVLALGSNGLAGATIIGGVAVVGIAAIAVLASDDDDNTSATSGSTSGT